MREGPLAMDLFLYLGVFDGGTAPGLETTAYASTKLRLTSLDTLSLAAFSDILQCTRLGWLDILRFRRVLGPGCEFV